MPELTPKLKIPKPLPPETVSLASFHEIYDAIDQNAASQEQVDQKFDAASGHKHTGQDGDAPPIPLSGIDPSAKTSAGGTEANKLAVTDSQGRVGRAATADLAESADMVDNIHFRVYNGVLQYNDGTGWRDVAISPIKSIQRGVVESTSSGDISITINAVDVSKSVVVTSGDGFSHYPSTSAYNFRYAVLQDSMTLVIKQRVVSSSPPAWSNDSRISMMWQVIEFN